MLAVRYDVVIEPLFSLNEQLFHLLHEAPRRPEPRNLLASHKANTTTSILHVATLTFHTGTLDRYSID